MSRWFFNSKLWLLIPQFSNSNFYYLRKHVDSRQKKSENTEIKYSKMEIQICETRSNDKKSQSMSIDLSDARRYSKYNFCSFIVFSTKTDFLQKFAFIFEWNCWNFLIKNCLNILLLILVTFYFHVFQTYNL